MNVLGKFKHRFVRGTRLVIPPDVAMIKSEMTQKGREETIRHFVNITIG